MVIDFMPQFYNISESCICLAAGHEPFEITALESLASGAPIVITKSGGMIVLIKDGVNGFAVEIKDYKELAEKCMAVLNDNAFRQRFSINGKAIVKEKYTKEIMTDNTLMVYEGALTGTKGEKALCARVQKKYQRNWTNLQGVGRTGMIGGGN